MTTSAIRILQSLLPCTIVALAFCWLASPMLAFGQKLGPGQLVADADDHDDNWRHDEEDEEHEHEEWGEDWEEKELEMEIHERHLEFERAEMEAMFGRLELITKVYEIADNKDATAAFAVLHVKELMEPEEAIDFLEGVSSQVSSLVVSRLIQIQLAELNAALDRPKEVQAQLRRLITGGALDSN